MISSSEVKRIAADMGVSPDMVEHDYVLGCFLHFLFEDEVVESSWIFKGGTALAKCYFKEYRFSEDLDFTATGETSQQQIEAILDKTKKKVSNELGIRLDVQESSVRPINDDYGKESFEGKLYYYGPWRNTGSPRSIRIHLNRDEIISFKAASRSIFHPYSDQGQLPSSSPQVYTLLEVLAEKLRAFSGQRYDAIARDIFDLWFLGNKGLTFSEIEEILPSKFAIKGLSIVNVDSQKILARKEEYEINWKHSLERLLPQHLKKVVEFKAAWSAATSFLKEIDKLKSLTLG